jgi:dihydrofolate reductase
MIQLITAMTTNSCIGINNELPWGRMSNDLKHFKRITDGKVVIMGRKTYESLGGIELPNREIIMITSTRMSDDIPGKFSVVHSIEEALEVAFQLNKTPIFIGGGTIYKEVLDIVDVMYITMVNTEVDGDTFFPRFEYRDWNQTVMEYGLADSKNDHDYTIYKLVKK